MAVTKVSLGRQTDLNATAAKITNLLDGTAATDAATYGQVLAVLAGLRDNKDSVRVVATTNGALATAYANGQVVDTVTLVTGNRILLTAQTTGSENGWYTVNAAGAPTRATDADTSAEVSSGANGWVDEGTNADSNWLLTTNDPIVLGTTALVFQQTNALGQITVDSTITKAGSQLSRPAITGDVTIATGSNASALAAGAVTLAKQANLAANSVIGNSTGSAATPTAVPMVTAPTASAVPIRDANANVKVNNSISNLATTATAAGTTTLTAASAETQQFTGTTTQTVVLPDATTLSVGHSFTITNRSTGVVTVNANGGGLIQTMAAGSQVTVTTVTIGTTAGTWDSAYSSQGGVGTVTSVSVVTANGFAGSVATPTATPAITLTTSITGVLKGNGTAISAAVAGTDYMVPAAFVDRETPTGTVNGSNTAFVLANTPVVGSEHIYLNGILQEPGAGNDYTISGTAITYLTAPLTGDKIRVTYRK